MGVDGQWPGSGRAGQSAQVLWCRVSEAVDNLHAIDRLVALANSGSVISQAPLQEAHAILSKLGLGNGAIGYKAEKLQAVRDGFEGASGHLIRDIDHLRKALARGAEGQD